VFQKTQTHRQAELTRLVTEMQAGLVLLRHEFSSFG
jgi:hypothetical protein